MCTEMRFFVAMAKSFRNISSWMEAQLSDFLSVNLKHHVGNRKEKNTTLWNQLGDFNWKIELLTVDMLSSLMRYVGLYVSLCWHYTLSAFDLSMRLTCVFQQISLSPVQMSESYEWIWMKKVDKMCEYQCVSVEGDFFPPVNLSVAPCEWTKSNGTLYQSYYLILLRFYISYIFSSCCVSMSFDAFAWLINCFNWIKCVTTHHRGKEKTKKKNRHLFNMKSMP